MQLNGLSSKRDDTFEPSGFIHTGTLRPEIFCNFPQQPEDFDPAIFFPLLGARWTRTKSGGYARYRIMHLCIWESDNIAHSSSGV